MPQLIKINQSRPSADKYEEDYGPDAEDGGMQWKSPTFDLAVAVMLAIGLVTLTDRAYAACAAEEKIDKSMVADARKRLEAAGYQKTSNLRKGCDNYWHATAEKNGKAVFVVLSPQGEVMEERD